MLNRMKHIKLSTLFTVMLALLMQLFIWHYATFQASEIISFPMDDAYITLQNAKNFFNFSDNQFIDSSDLQGSTSIAHTMLVGILLFIFNDLLALSVAGLIGGIIYILAIVRLIHLQKLNPTLQIFVLFLANFCGYTAFQLTNGLETSLAMAATAWAITLFIGNNVEKKIILPILLGSLPFVRPELFALSALLGITLAIEAISTNEKYLFSLFKLLVLALIGFLPFIYIIYIDTGNIIPNTISAKMYFFAEGCAPAKHKMEVIEHAIVHWFIHPLGISATLLLGLIYSKVGRILLVFIGIFFIAYFLKLPGALGHYEGRYFYILIPILILGATNLFSRWSSDSQYAKEMFALIIVSITIHIINYNLHEVKMKIKSHRGFTKHELESTADWVNNHTNLGTRILIHDAGYISYATQGRHYIDLVGLKTFSNSLIHQEHTWRSCGKARGQAMQQIITEFQPDYLIVFNGWDKVFNLTEKLSSNGFHLQLKSSLNKSYQIYKITY